MGRSIAKHAAEVIAGQGPLPIERLAEVLVGAGTTKARDPLKAVLIA